MMKRTPFRLTLCSLFLAAVLAFIWGNSLLPGEDSGEMSGFVGAVLQKLLPFLDLSSPQGMHLLRKAAHFSEFAALGFGFTWLYGMLCKKRLPSMGLALLCGVSAAAIDETLQIFTPNRGPGIKDVGIDSLGVVAGILFLTAVHLFFRKLHKKTD